MQYDRIAIYGRSMSGKSVMMGKLTQDRERLIVFDTVIEREKTAKKDRLKMFSNMRDISKYVYDNYAKGFRVWLCPDYRKDPIEALSELSDFLLDLQDQFRDMPRAKRQDITLAVDELADCFPNKLMPKEHQFFERICRMGRHKGIHLVGAAQRPAEISTKFRGQCSVRYVFALNEPRDKAAIAEFTDKDTAEAVGKMPNLEYFRVENGQITTGKIKF